MAKIDDLKVTVELDDEDRERIDTLIKYLRHNVPNVFSLPVDETLQMFAKIQRVVHLQSSYRDVEELRPEKNPTGGTRSL